MTAPAVHIVPALSDNYVYVIQDGASAVLIDACEAAPVIRKLDELGLTPAAILLTHYDADHVLGLGELTARYGCRVRGPEPVSGRVDGPVRGGETIEIGNLRFDVIDTPGHSRPHVCFHEAAHGWLFSGDCLFGGGCGRVRGGAYADMYRSLQKLAALPDETLVYFGHEYTADNLAFAASTEPGNAAIEQRRSDAAAALRHGRPTAPSTIALEKATNPFLREGGRDAAGFEAVRRAKDRF